MVVLAGQFRGKTVWTLDGIGSTLDVADVTSLAAASLISANGATWVLPAGWVPQLGAGNSLSTSGTGSGFINQANLAVSGVIAGRQHQCVYQPGHFGRAGWGRVRFQRQFPRR